MEANSGEAELGRLLAHSDWLSALARRLTHDPAAADDLVQDTWHAVLRAPATGLRSERGWLATLIANLARARARGEHARAERERRSAREEGIDGPDVLVERAEAQRRLLAHLLALEEPYRGTLLSRFVEGRSAASIARRTGVNESTVRTRISRGLAQLRERLEREHPRDAMLGLGVLIGSGAGPLTGQASAGLGTVSKALQVSLGVWIMGTQAKLALGVAAALLLCLFWRTGSPDMGGREVETAPDRATALVEPPVDANAPAPAPPERGREALASAPQPIAPAPPPAPEPSVVPPANTATLEVVFLRDDQAVPGVTAWLVHHPTLANTLLEMLDARYQVPPDAPREVSTASGAAKFTGLRATHRYYLAYATEPRAARPSRLSPNELHAGYAYEVRLGSGVVHGHVFDPSGRPRVGVGVQVAFLAPDPQTKLMQRAMTVTDERGAYRIDSLRATDYAVVMEPDCRFDGHGEVEEQRVRLAEGEVREVDFGTALPGTRWSGRVLNAFGEPFLGRPRLVLERADESQERITVVGVDGQFELAFTPGTWRVTVFATGCPGAGFQLGTVDLPNSDVARDIVVPGTRVQGRVLSEDPSQPISDGILVSFRLKGHDYPSAFRKVDVDEGGRYSIDGLGPGTWLVRCYPGELAGMPEVVIVEGMGTVERDLRWAVE